MQHIHATSLSKAFGPTKALSDVSLELHPGEVHGVLGENGAGKSTLVKSLSGVLVPDTGAVTVGDHELRFGSPRFSRAAGVATAFQELSLVPNLSVAQNLLMPALPRGRTGLVSRSALRRRARAILEHWQLDVSPDAPVDGLALGTKQRLEIVKALSHEPKLLILDEPTAALADVDWLFGHIRTVTAAGGAVLYISHRLPEIRELCDRGTVLRNGRVVGTFTRQTFDESTVISQMIGRSLEATFPERQGAAHDETALEVRDLRVDGALDGVSLRVQRGEVVGIAGLEGQGQRDLFYALYGQRKIAGGTIEVDGRTIAMRSARSALRAGRGVALVPEERKTEALFLELSSRQNMTIPIISELAVGPFLSSRREHRRSGEEAEALNIAPAAMDRPVGRLSGGNQQKVVLAKTLLTGAQTLLLFDPTRGIDAATKHEIYALVRRLADRGCSVLVYSTEIPELVGLCDRVYTIYRGRITDEFGGDRLTEDNLMAAAIGHARTTSTPTTAGVSEAGAR